MAQAVAQGITQGVSGAFAVIASKENSRCFNCGDFGHFIAECPGKGTVIDSRQDHQWLADNPKWWWGRKNSQAGVGQHCATTSNAQPNQPMLETAEVQKSQFPHGKKIQPQNLHPAVRETCFTPRFR